jgi:ankyrin repeat protein
MFLNDYEVINYDKSIFMESIEDPNCKIVIPDKFKESVVKSIVDYLNEGTVPNSDYIQVIELSMFLIIHELIKIAYECLIPPDTKYDIDSLMQLETTRVIKIMSENTEYYAKNKYDIKPNFVHCIKEIRGTFENKDTHYNVWMRILTRACQTNDINIVKLIVKTRHYLGYSEQRGIITACENGYTEIVKLMYTRYRCDYLLSLLSITCSTGNVELLEFLIEQGMFKLEKFSEKYLEDNKYDSGDEFIDNGFWLSSILDDAIKCETADIIKLILKVAINLKCINEDIWDEIIYKAQENNKIEIIKYIKDTYNKGISYKVVNCVKEDELTTINNVIINGSTEKVKNMVFRDNVLELACKRGNLEVVSYILSEITKDKDNHKTIGILLYKGLRAACLVDNIEIIKIVAPYLEFDDFFYVCPANNDFLKKYPFILEISKFGHKNILKYVCEYGNDKMIDKYINNGIITWDTGGMIHWGQIPGSWCGEYTKEYNANGRGFMWACINNNMKILKIMIKNGVNEWGLGLYLACKYGNMKIAKFMINNGAKPTDDYEILCHNYNKFNELEIKRKNPDITPEQYDEIIKGYENS